MQPNTEVGCLQFDDRNLNRYEVTRLFAARSGTRKIILHLAIRQINSHRSYGFLFDIHKIGSNLEAANNQRLTYRNDEADPIRPSAISIIDDEI